MDNKNKSSDEFFKTLLDTTTEAFFLHDKEGTFLNVNQQACNALGYTREELLKLKVSDIEIGPDPETLNQICEELEREKKVRIEGIHCRKDATTFPVEVSIGLINIENKDLFTILARDISEQKNIENKLTTTIQLLQAVLDTIPSRVFWKDTNNNYLGCNQSFAEDANEKSSEDLIGKNDFDLPWKEQAPQYRKDDTEVMQSGKSRLKFEEPQTTPEGKLIWLETSKIPLKGTDGEVYGVLGTYQDITEQKKFESELIKAREDAEYANMVKSKFLSHMSHEFRTPMTAILGYSELLKLEKDPLTKDQKLFVESVISGGNHLMGLINEILELSDIKQGEIKYTPEDHSLNNLLKDCLLMIQPLLDRHGIQITNNISLTTNHIIHTDDCLFKRIILNILTNAIKYNSDKGTVILSCKITSDNNLHINIRDTGIGINEQEQQNIFKSFERAGEFKGIDGAGVGLATAKKLVNIISGRIGVKSEIGKGSNFWIEVPLA